MAKDSFKVKKSLNIKPTDPSTLTNREAGDIIVDSTDNNKLKTYNPTSDSYQSVSTPGGLDTVFVENFESNTASSFTTGNNNAPNTIGTGTTLGGSLDDETTNQISGERSLKYVMNATSSSSDDDFFLNDTDVILDEKQKGNFLGISFYYTYNGSDDDIRFFVLDQDDNELTQSDEYIKANSTATRFSTSVFIPSSDTALRYGFQVVTGNSSKVFIVDDIELSTNPFVYKELMDYQSSEYTAYTGHGSTNTKIPYWTNDNVQRGGGIYSVENSSVNGFSLTALRDCTVSFEIQAFMAGNNQIGFSLESAQKGYSPSLTTDIGAVSELDGKITWYNFNTAGTAMPIGITINMKAGEILRPHSNGAINGIGGVFISATAETEHVVTPAKAVVEYGRWDGHAGYGSSNTLTPYFSTERENVSGEIVTVTNNSTNGFRITAIKKCEVDLNYYTRPDGNGNDYMGVAFNQDNSIDILTLSNEFRLAMSATEVSDVRPRTVSVVKVLEAGQFIDLRNSGAFSPSSNHTGASFTARAIEAEFLAAVPVEQIAYINNTVASGGSGQSFTINGVTNLQFNEVKGDSFASLSSNQITLPPGRYDIEAFANVFALNSDFWGNIYLYDETNSQDTEIIGGGQYIGPQNNYNSSLWKCSGPLVLTSTTTFSLRAYTNDQTGTATGNFGYGVGTSQSMTHVQVKIRKLK